MPSNSQRVRSLEEVTRELLALQTITNTLISTSYLDDILGIIVEGLEKGLNYTAGILFITETSDQSLYPHLTYRSPFVQMVEEKLGCTFSSISIKHNVKGNLLAQAAQQRKILQSEYLSEVLHGAANLAPDLNDQVGRATGVKRYIAVPMVIRGEVAGVILCASTQFEITHPEIESLKNFANQAGVALDNTQMMNSLKSAQRELSKQNDQLNKAYKDLRELEALKEGLVGMVVHDLKNPLTSVRGYVELLLEMFEGDEKNERYTNYLKKAYEGSEELLKMIHNLLDISRMEDGKFQLNRIESQLEDILKSVFGQLEIVAKQNHRHLIFRNGETVPTLSVDFDILQRVMSNLVSNAIKHTRKEGTIEMSLKADDKGGVTFCVKDDGEGIPAEHLESIFEKFSQVKGAGYRNTHNVGLGLTFCKMAVETHGGKIWAESEVDKGSRFFVWLPKG